jgi:hypothetical protein
MILYFDINSEILHFFGILSSFTFTFYARPNTIENKTVLNDPHSTTFYIPRPVVKDVEP